MIVWITRDVLKKGIFSLEVTNLGNNVVKHKTTFFRKPDWHETELAAKTRAQKVIQDKINRLKSQINKLIKLKDKYET